MKYGWVDAGNPEWQIRVSSFKWTNRPFKSDSAKKGSLKSRRDKEEDCWGFKVNQKESSSTNKYTYFFALGPPTGEDSIKKAPSERIAAFLMV